MNLNRRKRIALVYSGVSFTLLFNLMVNFGLQTSKNSLASRLMSRSSHLTQKVQLANEFLDSFGFKDSQGYKDSVRTWQAEADSLNIEANKLREISDRYAKRALVFGYFID